MTTNADEPKADLERFHVPLPDDRRVMAAVNACEGVSTEALEAGAVKELLAAAQTLVVAWDDIGTAQVRRPKTNKPPVIMLSPAKWQALGATIPALRDALTKADKEWQVRRARLRFARLFPLAVSAPGWRHCTMLADSTQAEPIPGRVNSKHLPRGLQPPPCPVCGEHVRWWTSCQCGAAVWLIDPNQGATPQPAATGATEIHQLVCVACDCEQKKEKRKP